MTRLLVAGCTPARALRIFAAFACALAGAFAIPPAAAVADQAIPVVVETARTVELVNNLELSGTVTSPRVSQISVAVPGRVETVHHDSGATVAAGEVLLELDPALEQIAIRQADAEIAQAEAELADAKRRLGIAENLAERSFGPQNAVDQLKTEVATKTAAIERTKAQRASLVERLDRHYVRAPFAGIISRKMAEAGQWIVPGTTVFELVDMSGLRIDVPVPQQYFPQVRDDADVSLRFDALPDTNVQARIGALIPVSDPSVRTFTLRVLPGNTDLAITPGMSAQVNLSLQSGREGLVVSRDALVRYPDGRITVWVLEENGNKAQVKERRIEIGSAFDGLVHVRSGLKEGERVVVRGNEALREGQAVRLAS